MTTMRMIGAAAAVLVAAPALGQDLLWDTTGGQGNRLTSVSSRTLLDGEIVQDTEVADDFQVFGAVERLVMHGSNCTQCTQPELVGVFVHFYEWTADGPGALQAEHFVGADDPDFVYDRDLPRLLDITLPEAFQASGWHFVSAQLVVEGFSSLWAMIQANRENPINASVHFRDNLDGDGWAQDEFFGTPEFSDFSFELYGDAAPFIGGLSIGETTRSGRVVISGSGFGSDPGDSTVLIDGHEAIVTQRLGNEVHAYVPEEASIGTVTVQVVTLQGPSNTVSLDVVPRAADGRVLWRFQMDDRGTLQYIGRAPDGTLYVSDGLVVYALSAEGALLWISTDAWGGRPMSIGTDGTIYTGIGHAQSASRTIVALDPDGSTKWSFTPPQPGGLLSGPNVGPDGNIYAVQEALDSGGFGAFSLDPDGNLRWSNQGDPIIHSDPGDNGAVAFADDRVYVGVVTDADTSPVLWTFDFDGDQLWTTWPFQPTSGGNHPVVDPFGRVAFRWGQTGMRVLSVDGEEEWITLHPNGASATVRPGVDSAGNIYSGDFIGVELWSLDPDGSTRWVQPSSGELLSQLGVSPDDEVIVAGGSVGFGEPGWVRGYSTADGAQLWDIDLPAENGALQRTATKDPVFSADGATAYVTTQFAGAVNDYGYVWAIATGDPRVGDVTGDGAVDIGDLLALLSAWGPCPPPPASCPADLDGSGTVGIADLLVLLANWD